MNISDVIDSTLTIRGLDAGVNFLIDEVKYYELEEDPGIMSKVYRNIENHRKSDFNVK